MAEIFVRKFAEESLPKNIAGFARVWYERGVMKKRPSRTLCVIFSLAFILIMAVGHLSAQVPSLLEYDGFMTGNITGNHTIGVRLYNASTNGTIL